MRRTWLAGATVAVTAISIPVATASTARAATVAATTPAWNKVAATLAKKLVGDRYAYGGTSPAGFDCSGLTQYVYRHTGGGKSISRTADEQFLHFKRISRAAARPGDLVFFHDTSDPGSFVYHVGVYEGDDDMVAATTSGGRVELQSFSWAGATVTFGTLTHELRARWQKPPSYRARNSSISRGDDPPYPPLSALARTGPWWIAGGITE
jgi:cell wall-associated NlpC family hydrolase